MTDLSGKDGYAVNAQYYDLIFPAEQRDRITTGLRALLPGSNRIVEIGSGTGLFTAVLVEQLSDDGELFAVEPSAVMRAALATRLSGLDNPPVTILPEDAITAQVPEPFDAVVMLHMLTHLTGTDRNAAWRHWVPRLRPGGLVITDEQFPQEPTDIPPSVILGRTLGRRRYDTVSQARTEGDGMVWTVTYRVHEEDALVTQDQVSFPSVVVSHATIDTELRAADCQPVPDAPEGIWAWRKSDTNPT
ncbi:class I SAM-dependent methyltransferase [Yinghuangia sp. ASG 101]|uniref:class I SAM-dependent methyltransferase n=1 Tax=Yinghuangia sp. ASG 101 TaxID=2896848 RepID=UPI001E5468EB|nr:class I SAM-dependent methyltransferase [Yinghuangia sp. ASG 101]UGQ13958.1 class I SAM-dependent methyltransferase [Yinghuangia sp. ASG 101]